MECVWLRSSCFQGRPGLRDVAAVGWGTRADRCELLSKLKQKGHPRGGSVRRGACFQCRLVSLEKREEEELAIRD